ncbi:MAG TPA: zinc ribbon domain-containing protein [Terriglobia bacterium]|nr:zinc ribbon domain-containing protein [Terriglobia bacterium]
MPVAIAFALALGLAFYVAAPLLATAKDPGTLPVDVTPATDLKRRRLVVYENLKDLEFEYNAHKIAAKDYQALRETYTTEAAQLMTESRDMERASAEEVFIEREVAARRARRRTQVVPDYTCPKCGFENPLPVKFCGECGAKIAEKR